MTAIALAGGRHVARSAWVVAGIFLFVLALETTRAGSRDAAELIEQLRISGFANSLGLGWLFAYIVLSGSPVAAVAVSLFSEGVLNQVETYAMVAGSRLGASFIALAAGFLYFALGRRSADGLAIGVVALVTTFTTQGPALLLGYAALELGWLDGASVATPGMLLDGIEAVYGPLVRRLDDVLPTAGLLVSGVGLVLASFVVFDRALPQMEEEAEGIRRALRVLHRLPLMFLMGVLITLTTLSVSISITVLVPLALKGFIRREHVIPYMMGANIATFIDTLGASFLVGGQRAVVVVVAQVGSLAAISVVLLVFAYGPYRRLVLGISGWATASPRRLATFLAAIVAVPIVLLVL